MSSIGVKNRNKKLQTGISIIFIAFIFIIMTLPSSILSGYLYFQLIVKEYGPTVLVLCDNISFSFHGLKLFILISTNKQIYNEFKIILFCKK